MDSNKNEILFISTKSEIKQTIVSVNSILKNKSADSFYSINLILLGDIDESEIQKINTMKKIDFIIKTVHYKINTLKELVLELDNVLSSLDKVLYFNNNVLILKDLTNLYQTDINGFYAGAVEEFTQNSSNRFNIGVMLLNLKMIRKDNIKEKLISNKTSKYNLDFFYETFNKIFKGNVFFLPLINNSITNIIFNKTFDDLYLHYGLFQNKNRIDLLDEIVVVQFGSKYMPWKFDNIPFQYIWNFYYEEIYVNEKLDLIHLDTQTLQREFCEYKNNAWEIIKATYLNEIDNLKLTDIEKLIYNFETNFKVFNSEILYIVIENILEEFYKIVRNDKLEALRVIQNYFIKLNCMYFINPSKFNNYSVFKIIIEFDFEIYEHFVNIIPIAFATNEKYVPYLCTSISSLVENSNKHHKYKIYIIYTDISERSINKILKEFNNIKHISIEFIDVNAHINYDIMYQCGYFTKEMYYRILIPILLPMYNKVVYLDCDTIVDTDIANLYFEDIRDNFIAGSKNINCNKFTSYLDTHELIIPDLYINSGVLVFNIDQINQTQLSSSIF